MADVSTSVHYAASVAVVRKTFAADGRTEHFCVTDIVVTTEDGQTVALKLFSHAPLAVGADSAEEVPA